MSQLLKCYNCNLTLGDVLDGCVEIERICPNCRVINYECSDHNNKSNLRGKDFHALSMDLRCVKCKRVVMSAIGKGVVETKCKNCKIMIKYDIEVQKRDRKSW